jgi:hypothetical protein
MAAEIGKGSLVVCVNNHAPTQWYNRYYKTSPLTVGAIYQVVKVHEQYSDRAQCPWDKCGTVGYWLRDKKSFTGRWVKYCPNLFRPLNDGDTSLVENEKEIDSPISTKELEKA